YNKTVEEIAREIRQTPITGVTLGGQNNKLTVTSATNVSTSYFASAKSGDRILSNDETKSFTVKTVVGEATIEVSTTDTYASLATKIANASVTKNGKSVSLGLRANFDDTSSRFFISTTATGSDQFIQFGGDEDFVKEFLL